MLITWPMIAHNRTPHQTNPTVMCKPLLLQADDCHSKTYLVSLLLLPPRLFCLGGFLCCSGYPAIQNNTPHQVHIHQLWPGAAGNQSSAWHSTSHINYKLASLRVLLSDAADSFSCASLSVTYNNICVTVSSCSDLRIARQPVVLCSCASAVVGLMIACSNTTYR